MPRRPRRRRRDNGNTLVTLIVAGVVVLTVGGGAGIALLMWQRRPAAPDAVGGPVGLPAILPGVAPPAVPAVAALAPRPALPQGWIDFKHPEGAYSIYLPARAVRDKGSYNLSLPVPPDHAALINLYEADNFASGLCCALKVTTFKAADVPKQKANEAREYEAMKPKGAPPIVYLNWRGRQAEECVLPWGDGTTILRYFWVGNRTYNFSIHGTGRRPTDAECAAFFESFVLRE